MLLMGTLSIYCVIETLGGRNSCIINTQVEGEQDRVNASMCRGHSFGSTHGRKIVLPMRTTNFNCKT